MTPEQAANHPSKNVISRALGAEQDVDIDLKTIMVEPGTTFLLCSDGITRHIDDSEIGGLLANGNPASICDRLKEICYARGAEDNLTAVVVRVAGEPVFTEAAGAGDGEEHTVASTRSPFDAPVELNDEAEFSTNETVEIDELDDQAYLMEDPEEALAENHPVDLQEYSSSSVIVPAQQPPIADPPPAVIPSPRPAPRPYIPIAEERSTSSLSRLLSAVLFLLLGTVLGAGAYYFWLGSQPEPPVAEVPVLTVQKSNNISLTAFEEGRRSVDGDPAGYILKNAASPQVPEDYFLLGRAFFLTGKYWEAKRAFTEAKNRLATADPKNAKTLAGEISMALAIIGSPQATELFTKDMAAGNTAVNSNINTQPTR